MEQRNFAKTTSAAGSSPLARPWRKILVPMLLVPLFFAATAAAVPNVWAEEATLLDENSPDWQASSSGDVSPDGTWKLEYPGDGEAEISNGVMQLRPELDSGSSHSTLVTAQEVDYKGIHGKMDVRLDKSANADPWDSFWAMLAYVDQTTQINFMIRTDDPGGWMVSKRDHDHEGEDMHVTIAEGNEIPEAEEGHWYNLEWWIEPTADNENLHIKLAVDGETLVDTVDESSWDRDGEEGEGTSGYFVDAGKTVGAYSENSHTSWSNIWVESLSGGAQSGSGEEEESQPSDSGENESGEQQESTNDSESGEGSGDSSSDEEQAESDSNESSESDSSSDEEQAESDINDADSQIDQADSDGSDVEEASQLLDQANEEFESGDYEAATATAEEAIAAIGE
jgi:hypothetical protein